MDQKLDIKPIFLLTETGERESVVISIQDWDMIVARLEAHGDSLPFGAHGGAATISPQDILQELASDGIQPADLRVCR